MVSVLELGAYASKSETKKVPGRWREAMKESDDNVSTLVCRCNLGRLELVQAELVSFRRDGSSED